MCRSRAHRSPKAKHKTTAHAPTPAEGALHSDIGQLRILCNVKLGAQENAWARDFGCRPTDGRSTALCSTGAGPR